MKKRVNVTIPTEIYETLGRRKLNLSGLITDLLGDHLADNTITIQVNAKTKRLYNQVIANTGYNDSDVESLVQAGLELLLENKIAELEKLRQTIGKNKQVDDEKVARFRTHLKGN